MKSIGPNDIELYFINSLVYNYFQELRPIGLRKYYIGKDGNGNPKSMRIKKREVNVISIFFVSISKHTEKH